MLAVFLTLLPSIATASPVRGPDDERCPLPPAVEPSTVAPTINRAPGLPFRFSENNQLMLLGSQAPLDRERMARRSYGPVSVWHTASGRLVSLFGEETRGYLQATFTSDSRYAAIRTYDHLTVWRVVDSEKVAEYRPPEGEALYGASDGVILTTAPEEGRTTVYPQFQDQGFEVQSLSGRFVPLALDRAMTLQDRFTVRVVDHQGFEERIALSLIPDDPAARALAEADLARPMVAAPGEERRLWFYGPRRSYTAPATVLAERGDLRATGDLLGRVRIEDKRTGAEVGEAWVGQVLTRDPGVPDASMLPDAPEGNAYTAVFEAPFAPALLVARDELGFESAFRIEEDGTPTLQYRRRAGVHRMVFSADGSELYVHDFDGSLVTLDPTDGRILRRSLWGAGELRRFFELADGGGYAGITRGGDLFVWSREGELRFRRTDAMQVRVVPDEQRRPTALVPKAGHLRGLNEKEGVVRFHAQDMAALGWRLSDGALVEEVTPLEPEVEDLTRLNSSKDGRFTRYRDPKTRRLYIRDNARGRAVPAVLRRGETRADFGEAGELRISLDDEVYRWGPQSAGPVPVEPDAPSPPDHRSADERVAVWVEEDALRVRVGQQERRLPVRATAVALSPDGHGLAAGTAEGEVLRWDPTTVEPALRKRGHQAPVTRLRFSTAGASLVSAAEDGSVRTWSSTHRPGKRFVIPGVEQLAVRDDGGMVLASGPQGVLRWTPAQGPRSWSDRSGVGWLGFGPDGTEALVIWHDGAVARVPATSERLEPTDEGPAILEIHADERGWRVGAVDRRGHLVLHDLTLPARERWERRPRDVRSVAVSPDGCAYVSTDGSGVVELRDVARDRLWARFAMGTRGDEPPNWVVIDGSGRYDASNRGYVPWLHYVAELPTGMETLGLEQLRSYYFQPGLYPSLFASTSEPPGPQFDPFRSLHPETDWELEEREGRAPLLHITLNRRGGGYGRVTVLLDDREIVPNAMPPGADLDLATIELTVDLDQVPGYDPRAGEPNLLGVVAYSASGQLASRGQTRQVRAPEQAVSSEPHLWLVAVGTNTYADPRLDLKFAVKDAATFASALALGGREVFADRIHPVVLENPDRQGVLDAFRGLYVQPDDVVVTYFAGHGVVEDGQWLYPTTEANTDDWKRPGLREARTFSSEDLVGFLAGMSARRRVVVLDTCGAGSFSADLVERGAEDLRQQKLVAQLERRTGTYVLAGSAADAASKEDPVRGHGLLTWSLLSAMERTDEWHVDALFSSALDTLDAISGGEQTGYKTASREAQSFPLGRSTDQVRETLDLRGPEAVLVRSQLWLEGGGLDPLELRQAVDLSVTYEAPALDFLDAYAADRGFRIAGAYRVDGAVLRADLDIYDLASDASVARFAVEGKPEDPSAFASCVARSAQDWIRHHVHRGGDAPPREVSVATCGR